MKPIFVQFGQTIQQPAKLGTLVTKPTQFLSYAQNIDVQNDEYGDGVAVPGPVLTTITNNSELTGTPWLHGFDTVTGTNEDWLYIVEGSLGATNIVRRVINVKSGSTPSIEASKTLTITHSGHSSLEITDAVVRNDGTNNQLYIVGKDATDGFVQKLGNLDATTPSLVTNGDLPISIASFNTGRDPKIMLAPDNNIYYGHGPYILSVNTSDTQASALTLGLGHGVTALADWNNFMVVAVNNVFPHDFATRKTNSQSRIFLWDYTAAAANRSVICPANYISALVQAPTGNQLVFGGVNEGKSTIYEFTGYSFKPLVSYIGDLPRSNHSVNFDGQGRLLWITVDGQICRFNLLNGIFEHLGTITTGGSAGGMLARGADSPEFLVASGTGSTYTLKTLTFGTYSGDGDSEGITTPRAVSGLIDVPHDSTISAITLHLTRPLQTGEKVVLETYTNGSTTGTTYLTMEFATDGAISAKREVKTISNINSLALGVAFKMTDASSTAPPVTGATIEIE